jgi:predicted 3-demethylubiquinone-9 3-methyltransferase (glyoxalase superfamily)
MSKNETKKVEFGVTPFISFTGCAEEAVNYYISTFPNSKIQRIEYFKEGEMGVEGKVKKICFSIMGQSFMAMDFMVIDESDGPTPSWFISLYVNCSDETIFDNAFNNLSKEGNVLMGPEPLMNFKKVSWVTDKYGITWQLIYE